MKIDYSNQITKENENIQRDAFSLDIPEKIVTNVVDNIVKFLKKKYGEGLVNTNIIYHDYLITSYDVYSKVKTLINPYTPRIFEGDGGIYVPSKIMFDQVITANNEPEKKRQIKTIGKCRDLFEFEDKEYQCVLILGSGGTGKSMLIRHLFLDAIDSGYAIPILVNLRKYKGIDNKDYSIINLIYKSMVAFNVHLNQEQFFYSLKSGKYLILYDGLDEIKDNYRQNGAKEIEDIYMKYPDNKYVITSRKVIEQNSHSSTGYFRESFTILKSFYFFDMAPLNINNACSLVTKIGNSYDVKKTEKFKKIIRETLWHEHEDFLSTPLLLSIMYITYLDRLDDMLMNNLADYYTNVFDALYSKHELSKAEGTELRLLCEKMGYTKFKTLFSYVCFHSFFNQQYEFTTEELLTLIQHGVLKLNYSESLPLNKAEDFIQDITNRVCLLVQEGTVFVFLHRSIQSYFAAFYTTTLSDKDQEALINGILPDYYINSDFISILAGIERERLNKLYVFPMIKKIIMNNDFIPDLLKIIKNFKNSTPYTDDFSSINFFIDRFIPILIWIDCNYTSDNFSESENRVLRILCIKGRIKNLLLYYNYCISRHNEGLAKNIMQQYLDSCKDALVKTKLLDVMEQWVNNKDVIDYSDFQNFIQDL